MAKIKRDVNDRKGILGGSSLGAALGFSTYKTPYEVAEQYLGKVEEVSAEQQEIFDMGHALEDFVASQIERKWGVKVQRSNFAYTHPLDSRIICHPDRIAVGKIDGKRIGIEIKSSSVYDNRWGAEGTSDIPMDYLIQCLIYIACDVCDEVWLIRFSNNRLTRYIVEKTDESVELIQTIVQNAIEWMNNVDKGIMPEPISYKEATSIFNDDTSGDIYASEEVFRVWADWKNIQAEKKKLDEQEDQLKVLLVKFIGDKKTLKDEKTGDKLCTYSKVTSTRLDSKKLKAERPEIFDEYSNTTSYMQLR